MYRLWFWVLSSLSSLLLTACFSGGGSGATLTVTPVTASASPGDAPILLSATLTGASGVVNWSLSPAEGSGTLSATSGPSVQYTPPNGVVTPSTVTLTATSGSLGAAAQIALTPLAQFYADPAAGLDSNPGTQAKPLKTVKEALTRMAGATKTTLLIPGTYNEASGETWGYSVPDGITLKANSSGVVLQSLSKKDGFTFAKGATFSDLGLRGFATALAASTGSQTLNRMAFSGNQTDLSLNNTASATLLDCTSSGASTSLQANASSRLTVQNGSFRGSGGALSLQNSAQASFANTDISGAWLSASGSGSYLSLKDVKLHDMSTYGIIVGEYGLLEVEGGSFTNIQGNTSAIRSSGDVKVKNAQFSNNYSAIIADGGSLALSGIYISNSTWAGILLSPSSTRRSITFRMRGSSITSSKTYAIGYESTPTGGLGSIDLGTASDPGGNTLRDNVFRNLNATGNLTLTAVGNTWNPNIQGADAQGRYAKARVDGPRSGDNYYIGPGVSIQF